MKIYEDTTLANALAAVSMLLGYNESKTFDFGGYELEVKHNYGWDSGLGCWMTSVSVYDRLGKYEPAEVRKLDRYVNDILDRKGEEDIEGEEVFSVTLEDGTATKARKQDYILQAYWGGWKNVAVFPRSARGYRAAHKAMKEHECPNMQITQYF